MRTLDENISPKGCLFLLGFVFFGIISIQGCLIGQLVRHHASLYNRLTEVEKSLSDKLSDKESDR